MGNILAIDPALTLGWAHTESPGGVWRNPGETDGERFAFFGGWLEDMLKAFPTQVIAYETPFKRGSAAARLGFGWETIIKAAAAKHGCTLKPCSAQALKVHATGQKNAPKEWMLDAAKKRNPDMEFEDHNHVDATFLLDWALCN